MADVNAVYANAMLVGPNQIVLVVQITVLAFLQMGYNYLSVIFPFLRFFCPTIKKFLIAGLQWERPVCMRQMCLPRRFRLFWSHL